MTGALTLRRVPLMNIRAHPVRAAILLFFAFALAACVFGGLVTVDGMRSELSLSERRLGADLVVYPTFCLNQVDKKRLLMIGTPVACDQARSTLSRMDDNEDIAAVSYQLYIADTRPDGTPLWIVGYDPATDFVISPWMREGEDAAPPTGSVAVGAAVEDADGQVTLFGRQWPVGAHLLETGSELDNAVVVSMDTLTQVIAASVESGVGTYASVQPNQDFSAALVKVDDSRDVQSVTEWINLYVRKVTAVRSDEALVTTASDIRAHRSLTLGVLGFAWLVLLVALVVAQFALMNERQHEVYVWRTIGASRATIARVVAIESLILHAVGACVGVLVAAAALPLAHDAFALAALAAPGRSLPLAALTVVALVAFGVAGTRLALARVYRSVSGQKLAPI
jgi:hypothetical protein